MNIQDNRNTKLLTDVAVIRPLLIVLLVFYHAFAPYSGAWVPIEGFPEVNAYWWLDKLSFAFMLEMFVFVSGYVFGYQVRIKGESKLKAKNLFWGKFKRLLIPSMIFSLLYIIIFGDITRPIGKTLYLIVDSAGHMWFLPMLCWCFAGVWLIERVQAPLGLSLLLCLVLSIAPIPILPFHLTQACHYFFFFYLGYVIQRRDVSFDGVGKKHVVVVSSVLFAIVFPSLTILQKCMQDAILGGGRKSNCSKGVSCLV